MFWHVFACYCYWCWEYSGQWGMFHAFVVAKWFFQNVFDWWSWFWEYSDQWGLCLPACNCLIYAHGIENVLVSEACLSCLLCSPHDSFKECFDWWSWFENFLTSEACVCLLAIVWFMLMILRTFWSVRHVYLAFCVHDMTLSKNVLIDDCDLRIFWPVRLVFACLQLFILPFVVMKWFFQRTFWLIVIMRRFRPVKLVFACHCLICAHDVEDVFWSARHVLCLLAIEARDYFCC